MNGDHKDIFDIDNVNIVRVRWGVHVSYDSRHDNDNDDVTINPDNEAFTSLQDITVTQ